MNAPDMARTVDAPGRAGPSTRYVGPDVTRALALFGVIAINYHGYLNAAGAIAGPGSSWAERLFDPWTGVLATRFAATFMFVAGVGISLLTRRSTTTTDDTTRRQLVIDDRWRLVRRGTLLYAGGFVLDWIWPGTILLFYGATFVLAAALFALRTRWLALIGAASAVTAAGIQWWIVEQQLDGADVSWLTDPATTLTRSPRGLLLDTFVNGTHPLLPWLAFACAGMIVGRHLHSWHMLSLAAAGAVLTTTSYFVHEVGTATGTIGPVRATLLSTRPWDRGLLYTIGTLGSAMAAVGLVSWGAERTRSTRATRILQIAGQSTLSIYIAHVLIFRALVDRGGWVTSTGLDTALTFAVIVYAACTVLAVVVVRSRGTLLPLELWYRRFGE